MRQKKPATNLPTPVAYLIYSPEGMEDFYFHFMGATTYFPSDEEAGGCVVVAVYPVGSEVPARAFNFYPDGDVLELWSADFAREMKEIADNE